MRKDTYLKLNNFMFFYFLSHFLLSTYRFNIFVNNFVDNYIKNYQQVCGKL